MNYTKNPFANGLKTGRMRIVELRYFTTAEHLYQDPTLLTVMDACQLQLAARGYQFMLRIIRDEADQKDSNVERHIADGHILVSSEKITAKYLEKFEKSNCVVINNMIPGNSAINFDIVHSIRMLLELLLSKGSNKVAALIQNPKGEYSLDRRVKAYSNVCSKLSNRLQDLGVVFHEADANPYEEIRKLGEMPDSVLCLNHTENLVVQAKEKNLSIPQDLRFVAILDCEIDSYANKIPCVVLDWHELA